MNFKNYFGLLALILLLNSCSDDEDCCVIPPGEEKEAFEDGIFVLNEGNFGSGNSSVSFINEETGEVQSQIFNSVNGTSLGDTAQSIYLSEELAFIILNVSNTIEIVDRNTFETVGQISANLQNPRFATVSGNSLYVSNWGDATNPDDDYVAVFNLSDYSFDSSIAVAEGPEKIVADNGSVYTAHKGGYNFNDIISVINTSTNEVSTEIEVGDVPTSMIVDGSNLIVLSAGKPSYADVETAGSLSVVDLNMNTVLSTAEFPTSSIHPGNLIKSDESYYFTVGKAVYEYQSGGDLPSGPKFRMEEVASLYGFNAKEGMLYAASANASFTGNGQVFVYDASNGSLLNTYEAGINPNGVYFN